MVGQINPDLVEYKTKITMNNFNGFLICFESLLPLRKITTSYNSN
jgi:hypothetical protein